MSLYLQITVGDGLYLLGAHDILEIRSDVRDEDDGVSWQGETVPTIDLRAIFEEPAAPQACCILFARADGTPAALIADRVDGLAEYGAEEFCLLPPIGPTGGMIDAVAMRPADQRLLLRLCGESMLATATAIG